MGYPSKPRTTNVSIPARGPDEHGHGKHWSVLGTPGEFARFCLRVIDGNVTLALTVGGQEEKVWTSRSGWRRHDYFLAVLAERREWQFSKLELDESLPGVFRGQWRVADV